MAKSKKSTPSTLPQISLPFGKRVYGVGYDYSTTSCSGGCDGYCRCGRIVGERVTGIDDWDRIVQSFCSEVDPKSLDYYLVLRFLRRFLTVGDFEVETGRGWYGGEVYGVSYKHYGDSELVSIFNQLQTQTDRLQLVLTQEYGYLLPEVVDVLEWEIKEVDIEDVSVFEGHMKHVDQSTVTEYKKDLPHVICICLNDNGRYRLIDGRHRFIAATQNGKDRIHILVPKTLQKKSSKPVITSDEILRRQALAKLTDAEKRVLGLL